MKIDARHIFIHDCTTKEVFEAGLYKTGILYMDGIGLKYCDISKDHFFKILSFREIININLRIKRKGYVLNDGLPLYNDGLSLVVQISDFGTNHEKYHTVDDFDATSDYIKQLTDELNNNLAKICTKQPILPDSVLHVKQIMK